MIGLLGISFCLGFALGMYNPLDRFLNWFGRGR